MTHLQQARSVSVVKVATGSRPKAAFTLVELLVVVAIIAVLIALVFPAIQSARESARSTHCRNNLKQIGAALSHYHQSNGKLPVTCYYKSKSPFIVSPTIVMENVPLSWPTAILPQLEAQNHYDLFDFRKAETDFSNRKGMQTVMPTYVCPSDPAGANPIFTDRCTEVGLATQMGLWYPGSMGPQDFGRNPCQFCPSNISSPTNPCCQGSTGTGEGLSQGPGMFLRFPAPVPFDSVRDGLSNTVMVGEALPSQNFHNCAFGSNIPAAVMNIPINTPGETIVWPANVTHGMQVGGQPENMNMGFRSRHPGGCHVVRCDGSVKLLEESIEPRVYWALGTRAGGEGIEGQAGQ